MNQERAGDDLAGGHDLVSAVAVRTDARGMRSAAAVVTIGRRQRRSGGRALDPIAHLQKDGVFPLQVIGERGSLEIRRGRIRRHVAVPRFQIRQALPGVDAAADDQGGTDQQCGPNDPDEPAFHVADGRQSRSRVRRPAGRIAAAVASARRAAILMAPRPVASSTLRRFARRFQPRRRLALTVRQPRDFAGVERIHRADHHQ